ncbi:MAG: hypothetical protein ACI835_003970 [Planctomycetota bacterium]|jgi:hypothetical protein
MQDTAPANSGAAFHHDPSLESRDRRASSAVTQLSSANHDLCRGREVRCAGVSVPILKVPCLTDNSTHWALRCWDRVHIDGQLSRTVVAR